MLILDLHVRLSYRRKHIHRYSHSLRHPLIGGLDALILMKNSARFGSKARIQAHGDLHYLVF